MVSNKELELDEFMTFIRKHSMTDVEKADVEKGIKCGKLNREFFYYDTGDKECGDCGKLNDERK